MPKSHHSNQSTLPPHVIAKDELLRSVKEELQDIARECQTAIEEFDQLMREFGFDPNDFK